MIKTQNQKSGKLLEILMIEDNRDDIELTMEALKGTKMNYNITAVGDGVEAISFLRKLGDYSNAPRPDLILLDLNLPKKDGREVLAEIKSDEQLRRIPVVVLTTSEAEQDIAKSYEHLANCFITKPLNLPQLLDVGKWIESTFSVVKLPG